MSQARRRRGYVLNPSRVSLMGCGICIVQLTLPIGTAFPATAGTAIVLAFAASSLRGAVDPRIVAVGMLFLTIWSLNAFRSVDLTSHFRTGPLLAVSTLALASASRARIANKRNLDRFLATVRVLAGAAAVLIIVQAVLWNLGPVGALLNPLGPFSPPGPAGREVFEIEYWFRPVRPNGWYSEPSVAGWSLAVLAAMLHLGGATGKRPPDRAKYLLLAGSAFTFSLSGLTISIILLILFVRSDARSLRSVSSRGIVGLGLLAVIAGGVLIAASFGLLGRFGDLDTVGSSGNSRSVGLYQEVARGGPEQLLLGTPFDQLDTYLPQISQLSDSDASETYRGVHNGILLLPIAFGITGFAAALWLGILAARVAVIESRTLGPLVVSLVLAAAQTGALFGPLFVAHSCVALWVVRGLKPSEARQASESL